MNRCLKQLLLSLGKSSRSTVRDFSTRNTKFLSYGDSILTPIHPTTSRIKEKSTTLANRSFASPAHQAVQEAPSESLATSLTMSETPKILTNEDVKNFSNMFPKLVKDIVELEELRDMPETNKWIERMMHYNVPHGKLNRGLSTILAYRYLADNPTEENIQLSYVLGWCTELLQAFSLVVDDIMDGSETRRGNLCWYKVDNLGLTAFNDSILLEATIYVLLKKYFQGKGYYRELVETFHDTTYKSSVGQSLDTHIERNLDAFTMSRYSRVVKYKTSFYSFTLPVKLGMIMARINNPELRRQATEVTLALGHLFQVQDDYLDGFGDPRMIGKIGTDIQDYKCSWPCVVALERSTPEQRAILDANYGINNQENVERVKALYREMDIPKLFTTYEEQTYDLISTQIEQMGFGLSKQLFYDMLQKIYRRQR